jgi:hypothetical protein
MELQYDHNPNPAAFSTEDTLVKWTEVDLTDFVQPKIIYHQASSDSPPQAFTFDPKRITYDKDPVAAGNNLATKYLSAKYELPSAEVVELYVETPMMTTLFACSGFRTESNRNGKVVENTNYSLNLSFNDITTNQPVGDFYKAMYTWDKEILRVVFANAKRWLPGVIIKSVDALETLFSGFCSPRKRQKDGQLFPPALTLRIPQKGKRLDVTCVDKNNNPFDVTQISKDTAVRAVFRHQVVFKSKGIEVRNEAVLIQVMESARPTGFANPVF